MLTGIHGNIQEDQAIFHGESLFHLRLEIFQLSDAHANVTIGLSKTDKVRQGLHIGMRIPAAVLHILPLTNHAQSTIVQIDDFHRKVILQAGRQFLNIHLDTAFTRDTGDVRLREVHLHSHGGRKTEPHGAKPARVNPTVRLIKWVVLSGKHLMLADV